MKKIFNGDFKVTQNYHSSHGGLDIVGIGDIDVISPVNGTVKSSTIITDKTNLTWEWGNYVRVDDENGNRYYFCHLKSRAVRVGQKVNSGDKLGVMGNTGKSFGAHCHFETRTKSNVRTNPASFLEIPNKEAVYSFKNSWQKLDNRWYYYDNDGNTVKGFKVINNKVYYFAEKSVGKIRECQLVMTDKEGGII